MASRKNVILRSPRSGRLEGRAAPIQSPETQRRTPGMTTDPLPFARPAPGTQPPTLYPDYQSTVKRAPKRAPIHFEHTLSEVTGPIFTDRWAGPDATDL